MELFYPADPQKTLKQQYREFAEVEEFKDLSKSEEIFVWLYGLKTSPCGDIKNKTERATQALEYMDNMAGIGFKPNDKNRKEWAVARFSEKIKIAIERMGKFNVEERKETDTALKNIQKNLIMIANLDVNTIMMKTDDNGVQYFDAAGVNQFVNLSVKVADELPRIVRINEEGMGIVAAVSVDLASGRSPHQIFMEREKQKIKN